MYMGLHRVYGHGMKRSLSIMDDLSLHLSTALLVFGWGNRLNTLSAEQQLDLYDKYVNTML